MAISQDKDKDTEITLGTGKMLVLFFGLVALCAVFFGLGFKMGRGSLFPGTVSSDAVSVSSGPGIVRPSAVKVPSNPGAASSPDLAFFKSTSQKSAETQPTAGDTATAPSSSTTPPSDPTVAPPANGYYVQVAAVSRQEDGEALVDALKKKQYAAFASTGPDKLYHVQVGPFTDIKSAEDTRAKLTNDGYNPILKK